MATPPPETRLDALFDAAKAAARRAPRTAARGAIRGYQLTLSGLMGRQCRHLPSCSDYTAEAIGRYGLWAGGWMGVARICRCGPFGTHGIDNVPDALPARGRWYTPWAYGRWRGVNGPETRSTAGEGAPDDGGAARS
ncbi:membrane protein insertion efficiency factor YidD [Salinarimonas sp.]|uniref:membrane protein insertion efficiency factor YidD n=1 Tax=Salinarimonas sp. TaxID=2766526 RepID=UPI0032D8BFE8